MSKTGRNKDTRGLFSKRDSTLHPVPFMATQTAAISWYAMSRMLWVDAVENPEFLVADKIEQKHRYQMTSNAKSRPSNLSLVGC